MKQIIVSIILIFGAICSNAQNTDLYDQEIGSLINESKWFEVRDYHDKYKDSLSEFMRLFSSSLVNTYSNRPLDAIYNIQDLLQKYNERLGTQSFIFSILMADNYAELQSYQYAHQVYTNLLNAKPYLDSVTLTRVVENEKLYRSLAQIPPMQIQPTQFSDTINTTFKNGGIFFTAQYNGKYKNTIFDTGASGVAVDEKTAKEIGAKILKDSILVNASQYCKLGLIDSLKIGNILIVNVPCHILPNGFMSKDHDKIPKNKEIRFSAIIGCSVMKLISEIQIDLDKNRMVFNSKETKEGNFNNLLLHHGVCIVSMRINGFPAMMYWDTGQQRVPVFTENFYREHLNDLPKLSKLKNGILGGLEGICNFSYYELKNLIFQIPDKKILFPNVQVIDSVQASEFAFSNIFPCDGRFGQLPSHVKMITINFKQMSVCFD